MKHLTTILLTLFVLQSYAHPRPQKTLISNISVEASTSVDASLSANAESNDSQLYTKQGFKQRSPVFFVDILNIPHAIYIEVMKYIAQIYLNGATLKPPSENDNDESLPNLRSFPPSQLPVEKINESIHIASSNVAASVGAIPKSNNNQIIKQGMLRIPTNQDFFNIPISTLEAVSHFLTTASNGSLTQNATVTKVSSINSESKAVTKEHQLPTFLKSSPVSQDPVETPSHSTLIGANVDVSVAANPGSNNNQFNIKQLLQRNPSFYQDLFNVVDESLKIVRESGPLKKEGPTRA